jgi:hypothetical protein
MVTILIPSAPNSNNNLSQPSINKNEPLRKTPVSTLYSRQDHMR